MPEAESLAESENNTPHQFSKFVSLWVNCDPPDIDVLGVKAPSSDTDKAR